MYITSIYMPVHKTLTSSPSLCCAVLNRLSAVQLFAAPWIIAHQALLSMGFFRQEYRSGLPFPFQVSNPHLLCLRHVQLFAAPWTIAHQALLSRGFFRQEYRSGLPFPFQGSNPHLLCLRHCGWILHPLSHGGLIYAHM